MAMLTAAEKLNWLRLIRSPTVGAVTFWALLERYGTAARALEALPVLARRGGAARPLEPASAKSAMAELEAGAAYGASLLACGEPDYPQDLARLDPAPPLIWSKGHLPVLRKRSVAIVGARNASALGRRFAEDLARELGQAGFAIASGLARGIDAAAHRGAAPSGTIAVMAGGVDKIYPPENVQLAQDLQATGALISEMPMGHEPQARNFPRRNRLIAGLGLGVVVVEAALHSGSLITARYALEADRDVFAVPGSPLDPRARGCNDLLRQGAILTEGAGDVLAALEPSLVRPARAGTMPPLQPARIDDSDTDPRLANQILELIGPAPTGVDELIRQTGAPSAAVAAALLELELAGRVARLPGQHVARL
jgi:DNA processing protein